MGGTINDVVRVVGVSKSTVSRVLNESGPVSPETELGVRRAVSMLGYRPSFLYKLLKARGDGFVDAAKKGGLKIVARQPADSQRRLDMSVMRNMLQAHPIYPGPGGDQRSRGGDFV